ncbi:MAG TPA: hypothetical protein PKA82_16315 [Pyrinomonadaceae bacterium]|nr:hypothetical protein [Pyrinomonadaceae bacterium]
MESDTYVNIAPSGQGLVNVVDLIRPEGQMYSIATYKNLKPGVVFEVIAPDYVFGVEIREKDIVLLRCGTAIIVPLAEPSNREKGFIYSVGWSPTTIQLHIQDSEGRRGYEAPTAWTYPPQSLKRWARERALISTDKYDSEAHLLEAVMDQFQKLRQRFQDIGGTNGFWDIHRDGQRIVKRVPKHEPDIHPTIRHLLDDLEITKNFQIVPEYHTGTGRLDFLISAPLVTGKIGRVCVEFKNAHSKDLAHGIQSQLPNYMESTSTDFGIYVVLDYGADYPFNPNGFQADGFPGKIESLDTALNLGAGSTRRKYLRFIVLPVGQTPPPSKN